MWGALAARCKHHAARAAGPPSRTRLALLTGMTTEVTVREGTRLSFGLIVLWFVAGVGFVIVTLFGGPILIVPALIVATPIAIGLYVASHQKNRRALAREAEANAAAAAAAEPNETVNRPSA